jgi:putative chitobiose transport system permease protein
MKKNIKRFFRIKRTRKINRSLAGNMTLFIFMGICGLFMAAPLALIISNAFKPLDELFRYPPLLFPRNPSFDNFSDLAVLMSNSWVPLSRYILNTVIIVGGGTIGHVMLASLAAYPLAKRDFPGAKLLFSVFRTVSSSMYVFPFALGLPLNATTFI